jgi:hypothetical protein
LAFEKRKLGIGADLLRTRIVLKFLLQLRERGLGISLLQGNQVVTPQELQRSRRRFGLFVKQISQGAAKRSLSLAQTYIALLCAADASDKCEQHEHEPGAAADLAGGPTSGMLIEVREHREALRGDPASFRGRME